MKLTDKHLRDRGFASSFSSDPQQRGASKLFRKNGLDIFQFNEDIQDFGVESPEGEIETLETVRELEMLMYGYNLGFKQRIKNYFNNLWD